MTTPQKRRKKTRDAKRIANIQRSKNQATRAAAAPKSDRMSWDRLALLFQQCLDMYVPISAIGPVITSPEFRQRATQEQCKEIMDDVKQLTGHVNATLEALHDIRKKHFGRTGDVRGEKRTMEAIEIGMEYQTWVTKFNETVLLLSMTISGKLEEILADKEKAVEQTAEPLFQDIDVTADEVVTETTEEVANEQHPE